MSILDGLFNFQGAQDEQSALMDYYRQQQAGMGTTLKYLYDRVDTLEKRIAKLENKSS